MFMKVQARLDVCGSNKWTKRLLELENLISFITKYLKNKSKTTTSSMHTKYK